MKEAYHKRLLGLIHILLGVLSSIGAIYFYKLGSYVAFADLGAIPLIFLVGIYLFVGIKFLKNRPVAKRIPNGVAVLVSILLFYILVSRDLPTPHAYKEYRVVCSLILLVNAYIIWAVLKRT